MSITVGLINIILTASDNLCQCLPTLTCFQRLSQKPLSKSNKPKVKMMIMEKEMQVYYSGSPFSMHHSVAVNQNQTVLKAYSWLTVADISNLTCTKRNPVLGNNLYIGRCSLRVTVHAGIIWVIHIVVLISQHTWDTRWVQPTSRNNGKLLQALTRYSKTGSCRMHSNTLWENVSMWEHNTQTKALCYINETVNR